MKKILAILFALSMLTLTGCSSQTSNIVREPDELELIRTIGVDKSEKGYRVTIGTDVGLNGSPPQIRSNDDVTIDSALNVLQKTSRGQEPFYSHTDHIIVGQELAKDGIGEVLDYVARNSEMRIGTNLFIAKDATAEEIIVNSAGERNAIADMLDVMKQQISSLGQGYVFTCLDVATGLAADGKAIVLAIEMTDGDNMLNTEEKKVLPSGFGIIDDAKLVSYVPASQAAGVTILINKMNYMLVNVVTDEGTVGLAVTKIDTKLDPIFLDDQLQKLKITVKADASVTEDGGVKNLATDKVRRAISLGASNQILKNLQETLRTSQELGIDYIGIGKKVELKAPLKFESLKKPWREIFTELPIEIEVQTELKRSYDLDNPMNLAG